MRRGGRASSKSRGTTSTARSRSCPAAGRRASKLAALLLHEPNLLLLDEPTNFLDLRTQILLEHFLRNYDEACLIVSHDRALPAGDLRRTRSTCRAASSPCTPARSTRSSQYQQEQPRARRDGQRRACSPRSGTWRTFIAKNKARASHGHARKSKEQAARKARIHRDRRRRADGQHPRPAGRTPQRGRPALPSIWRSATPIGRSPTEIDVEVDHGSRAAIVGDNGQGKTTFLRTIVDSLTPLAGEVRWGHGCKHRRLRPARLHQPAREADGARISGADRAARDEDCRRSWTSPASLLFRGGATSRRRFRCSPAASGPGCAWRGCCSAKHNVLILDEPGNHLDVDTVDALAEALHGLQGDGDLHQPRPALHEARGHVRSSKSATAAW